MNLDTRIEQLENRVQQLENTIEDLHRKYRLQPPPQEEF
jgi:chaperonin cofactor prefoldin